MPTPSQSILKPVSRRIDFIGFIHKKIGNYIVEKPRVGFNDIAGEEEAKNELRKVVEFLRNPRERHSSETQLPCRILLAGPSGTGKTLLAHAVAGEAGVPIFSVNASRLAGQRVGQVRRLFALARAVAPAIIFVDELDGLVQPFRAGLSVINGEYERLLSQLSVEVVELDFKHPVAILAATNCPGTLDPALLKPWHFDRQLNTGLPDRREREGILSIHTRKLHLATDVNLGLLARTTTGFNGAELEKLCNEASRLSAGQGHELVYMADFETSLEQALLGATYPDLLEEHERQVVAYHEAGHALAAWLIPDAQAVHKVSILPQKRDLDGSGPFSRNLYSRGILMSRLAVLLGGRAAEEIALGDVTTIAEYDLDKATNLATKMVTRWGMGALGLMTLGSAEQPSAADNEIDTLWECSEETMARVDRDVQRLLDEAYLAVREILSGTREKLDQLAQALLREETLNQEDLAHILGRREFGGSTDLALYLDPAHTRRTHD
jgi:cell division protease FtsH